MKNYFLKENHDTIPFLKEASIKSDYVLITVNAHSEMGMISGEANVGNFISYCVKQKLFSKIIWIKEDKNIDIEDGFYEFSIFWDRKLSEWKCNFEHFYCFFEDSFAIKNDYDNEKHPYEATALDERIKNPINVQLEVISEKNLAKSRFAGLNWVLSIDCSFFSAANPFKAELTKTINRIGKTRAIELKERILKIKAYNQWDDFKKRMIASEEWPNARELIDYSYTETDYSDKEIDKKILNILTFLKKNFPREKCLQTLTCISFFSGYTLKKNCPAIVSSIGAVFENFDFFWEMA